MHEKQHHSEANDSSSPGNENQEQTLHEIYCEMFEHLMTIGTATQVLDEEVVQYVTANLPQLIDHFLDEEDYRKVAKLKYLQQYWGQPKKVEVADDLILEILIHHN